MGEGGVAVGGWSLDFIFPSHKRYSFFERHVSFFYWQNLIGNKLDGKTHNVDIS